MLVDNYICKMKIVILRYVWAQCIGSVKLRLELELTAKSKKMTYVTYISANAASSAQKAPRIVYGAPLTP